MHRRVISNHSAIWKFFCVRKQKDGLISFSTLNNLEAKIFQYVFLEGHDVWENNHDY